MPPPAGQSDTRCSLTRVIGLLEVLDDRGGARRLQLGRELNYKFGELLKVMKAAELLGFVDTPKRHRTRTAWQGFS